MDKHIIASSKYEVILDKSEAFEFCLYVVWDQIKRRKYIWIFLIFIIVVDSFIIPEAALVLGVVILIAIVLSIVVNYKMFQKMLWNQKWVIWVENGLVRDIRENYSEVPCDRVQFFCRTRRLQMFGFMRSARQIAWYVIPLRMFHNEQERQQFIDQLQHSQMTEQETEIVPEQEIFHFSYILNYPTEVFSFDFEGYDIGTDYIEVLNGMLALAKGSCLDSVSNIREDTTKVNWEQGDGKITLYLEWNGQEYTWDMDVYYDWIDSKVIGVLNVLLLEEGTQKLFYMTGDNGQGAIIFFVRQSGRKHFQKKRV